MKNYNDFLLGYDFLRYTDYGVKIPILAPVSSHLIVVGGSGSGKSTALLYWLYQLRKFSLDLYIADFKASKEFLGLSSHVAEFEDCYSLIKDFYQIFLSTPEGGDDTQKVLILDEVAGLLTHFGMTKEGKAKADEIRMIMSIILMLGRSKKCYLWLSMQRYTATIFPSSSTVNIK